MPPVWWLGENTQCLLGIINVAATVEWLVLRATALGRIFHQLSIPHTHTHTRTRARASIVCFLLTWPSSVDSILRLRAAAKIISRFWVSYKKWSAVIWTIFSFHPRSPIRCVSFFVCVLIRALAAGCSAVRPGLEWRCRRVIFGGCGGWWLSGKMECSSPAPKPRSLFKGFLVPETITL